MDRKQITKRSIGISCMLIVGIMSLAPNAAAQCQPATIGTAVTPDDAQGVDVVGSLAYVTSSVIPDSSSLTIFNVSNPANPVVVGSIETPGFADGVTVSGDVAYVADTSEGVQLIDVSDPANPSIVGNVGISGGVFTAAVSGDLVCTGSIFVNFQVVDVSNPTSPSVLGTTETAGYPNDIVVDGDIAYVSNWDLPSSTFLQAIDISDPADPTVIGSLTLPGNGVNGIALADNLVYVANRSADLQIVDVSNPNTPTIHGAVSFSGSATDVVVSDDLAYVITGDVGPATVKVIDITDPANPVVIASHDLSGTPNRVARSGNQVYVASSEAGLQVVDMYTCTLGACCLGDGCLDVVTQNDCQSVGGTFLGNESTCAATLGGGDAPAACDADCNANGVPDYQDVASGVADDCDLDGEPDSCVEPLPFDGYSMEFTTVDDRAIVDQFTGFPSNNMAVSMWVKTDDITRNSGLFSYAVPGSSNELVLSTPNNLSLSAQGSTKTSNVSIADGVWHHVAVTFTDFGPVDNAVLYVDGQFVWTTNFTSNEEFTNAGTVVLGDEQDCLGGCFVPDEALIGHIDEVRVWNVSRTASQINSDMNTPLTGNEPGLVGYWPFNEGNGDVAADLAGSNDATLPNGGAWLPTGGCAVPGDLDGDDNVGVSDLLQLLSMWGACDGCPEDLDNNGSVDVSDLLTLLANWS